MARPQLDIEPVAVWSNRVIVFDKDIPNSQNIILSQGSDALRAICWRIDDLYRLLSYLPHTYLHPQIPSVLSEIFFHQGVASTIMFNGSARGHNESATAYKHRMLRFEYVKHWCGQAGVETPILSNRKVRNHIVHIDDHLLKAMRHPNTGWSIDSAFHARDFAPSDPTVKVGYCRTFIVSEETLIHLDSEVPIRDLYQEAGNVLQAVFGLSPAGPPIVPFDTPQDPQPQPPQTQA